jgi:DNA-binding MltR family transcriptional regulator
METKERAKLVQKAMSQLCNMELLADFPVEKITEFRCTLTEETDRGCALMAAAYLDDELGEMIRANLVQNKKVLTAVFENNGPASTFSARIDLAYLCGLLSSDARHDLHLLRKIRNDFAHNPVKIGFSDSPICDRCLELKLISIHESKDPRLRFTNAMMGVFAHIHAKKIMAVVKEPMENVDLQKHKERAKEVNTALRITLKKLFEELPGYNKADPPA